MPSFLSRGVVQCGIALSLGWLALASAAISASGAATPTSASSVPRLTTGMAVQLEQRDPCTQEPLAIDARLTMTSTTHLNDELLQTRMIVTLYGSHYVGPGRTEERITVADSVVFVRDDTPGLLEPYELALRMVERPTQVDTLFHARLQPFWDGASMSLTIIDAQLTCG